MVDTGSERHAGLNFDTTFQKLEIVAYVGDLKVVGLAHFGVGQRQTSRRASDFIRSFGDERLTVSQARIYSKSGVELLETSPFVILNLRNIDLSSLASRPGANSGRPPTPAGRPAGPPYSRTAAPTDAYRLDILIPTARFAFAVEGQCVDVLPEHRSPEAYGAYQRLKAEHAVVGMTTFPNTVLLRGPRTLLIDPGLHLQNEPVLRALETRGWHLAMWTWYCSRTLISTTPVPVPTITGR